MEKRRLEVVIETDGGLCGSECPMWDTCIDAREGTAMAPVYDWPNREWRRSQFCKANAKEETNPYVSPA